MTPDELERARRAIAEIARARPLRRSRRRTPDPRGDRLDVRQLVRRSLRSGGDAVERPRRARKVVPRKLVVLCDVSGSMSAYARAILLFLHAAVGTGGGVEAFAFGTRLARLTHDLGIRDPEAALARVTAGAARLGQRHAHRRLAPRARRHARLAWRSRAGRSSSSSRTGGSATIRRSSRARWRGSSRVAYAIVWVNPLKGRPEYEPLAGGMRAALPFVDRFLPGNNLESLEALGTVLSGIERRHAA